MQNWREQARTYAAMSINRGVRLLEQRFPEILWSGNPLVPEIALTFDDGPNGKDTPALLAVLAKHNVQATFSWLGERVQANPELVEQVAAAGHQLMVHGYRHRSFLLESKHDLRTMLDTTRTLLSRYSGRDAASIRSVRPPYGHFTPAILRWLVEWGYKPVMGSMVPLHWRQAATLSVRQVLTQTQNGSLIVLHESLGGPPVAALTDTILTNLVDRNLCFVTVDALRAGRVQ